MDTRISIRTPVGITESAETGEGWAQGSSEGAIVSTANLAHGVDKFFSNSKHDVFYGTVRIKPVILQDDVCRIAISAEAAQAGVCKMEAMAETKVLDFNQKKSVNVIIGSPKGRQKLTIEIEKQPLFLYGKNMEMSGCERYLGDQVGGSLKG